MIDLGMIQSRLDAIDESVRLLKELKGVPLEAIASDSWKLGGAKYYLQTSIEAVLDICKYLVANAQHGMPEMYRDLALVLSKEGVFPKEFAVRLAQMIGLRNVLVHQYLQVDLEKLHMAIQKDLGDFDEFARYIVAYLEKEGIQ